MQIAIVANRATPTNVSLASHPWPGRRPLILSPRETLQRLRPGDVALGRLDVRPSLAGIEPGMPQLRQLEERGVRVLNGAGTLTATHDKLVTARALAAAGLAHPTAVHVTSAGAPSALPEPPLVLKPRFGSWGREVTLCETEEELERSIAGLAAQRWSRTLGALAQALVPPLGWDLRVVVAGGQVVGAVRRMAAPGEWRTNIALGGTRRQAVPDAAACELALAAAAAVGGALVGVDLLPARPAVTSCWRSTAPSTSPPSTGSPERTCSSSPSGRCASSSRPASPSQPPSRRRRERRRVSKLRARRHARPRAATAPLPSAPPR